MLCRSCRTRVRKDFPYCLRCGALRPGARVTEFAAPVLRWGTPATTVPLSGRVTTVGREPGNDVVIDHPSISRRHARIVRAAKGFVVEDLGSANGSAVALPGRRPRRGKRVVLRDHARILFGDVDVTFEQPRPVSVGSKTVLQPAKRTVLATNGSPEAPAATEPLSDRPRRRSGWALKQVGTGRWVLRNSRTRKYLSLDEREAFVWNQLDGDNSVREILLGYHERFGELALPRIEATLKTFADAELIRGLHGQTAPAERSGLRRFKDTVVRNLMRIELAIKNLDPLVTRLYRGGAWVFFTPVAVALLWALIFAGLFAFVVATSRQRLFDVGGAGVIGGVVVLAGYLMSTALHEAAHAFAVKSYGRRVNRGGVFLMMGMPFAFVDTSDMWFGTPWSRIVVAVSGPLTTAGMAGAAALGAAYVPDPVVSGVCFQLAAGLYVNTLFNFNPLLPLDGYQAIADALRTPRLREEAKAYFTRELWRDIRARRRPGARQLGLTVFALLSLLCLWGFLALGVLMWNSQLGDLLTAHVAQPWRGVLIGAGIVLLVFPVWYPPLRKLTARVRARAAG